MATVRTARRCAGPSPSREPTEAPRRRPRSLAAAWLDEEALWQAWRGECEWIRMSRSLPAAMQPSQGRRSTDPRPGSSPDPPLAWTSQFFLEEPQPALATIARHATAALEIAPPHRFYGGEARPVHPH